MEVNSVEETETNAARTGRDMIFFSYNKTEAVSLVTFTKYQPSG